LRRSNWLRFVNSAEASPQSPIPSPCNWLRFVIFLASAATALAATSPTAGQRAFLDKYCVTCHNQKAKTAGLALDKMDVANIPAGAETWEKVILKLRGGMMPPAGMPRPDRPAIDAFVASLEQQIDQAYLAKPFPGRVGLHRLNRAEYGNAVRDLLDLQTDVSSLLPADDANYGFDNIADSLTVSPVLMERYMTAAWKISGIAVGDLKIPPTTYTFRNRPDLSQDRHIEGLPLGTRGGILVKYNFPLDAEYRFKVRFWGNTVNTVRGLELPSQVEVTLDGARVKLVTMGGQEDADFGNTNPTASAEQLSKRVELQIPVSAGPHEVGFAFLQLSSGPTVELLQPYQREKVDPINTAGIPEIDWVSISGPAKPTGPGNTPTRKRIFSCRPAAGADPVPCARQILSTLARRAYRRPVSDTEMERLLTYFQRGQNEAPQNDSQRFDAGIETALAFILVNPQFLFRAETEPAKAAPGSAYHISDLELASRLSFFLWSSIPDDDLLAVASRGKLSDPPVLEQQIRRMLRDRRSDALIENFFGQWLYLRNLKATSPDQQVFPDFDDNLRQAFLRETGMFTTSIVREDRSVVDLLTANYTFLNERLAKHYGIPNVYGNQFRRVTLTDPARRGLLGQGSVLTVSSYANRTSPVLRGKWILTNILGTPPPPPPPNVPAFNEMASGTVRERMVEHRANPACSGCHSVMDPVGFAMENFDAVGHWRTRDSGAPIDATGALPDGTKVDGASAMITALAAHPEQFVRTMTSMMLTYALGRGLEYYDMPVVRTIARDAAKRDNHFSELVLGIVKSPPFQMNSKPLEEAANSVAQVSEQAKEPSR
jgi:cytochrome c551/c552